MPTIVGRYSRTDIARDPYMHIKESGKSAQPESSSLHLFPHSFHVLVDRRLSNLLVLEAAS